MALGDYPCGDGECGFDPVAPPTPRGVVSRVAAAFFDPSTRDYPLDASGRVIAVHPVDQAVALALTISRGALGSVSTLGHELRTIPRGEPAKVASYARDAVARALATLTIRGDVTLINVAVFAPFRGAFSITVEYRNNRLVPAVTRTSSLTA